MIEQILNSIVFSVFFVTILYLLLKDDCFKLRKTLTVYFFCLTLLLYMIQFANNSISMAIILMISNFLLVVFLRILNKKEAMFLSVFLALIFIFGISINNVFFYFILDLDTLDINDLSTILLTITIIARILILITCLISVRILFNLIKNKSATLFWLGLLSLNLLIPLLSEKASVLPIDRKIYTILVLVVLITSIFQYILLIMILKFTNNQRRDSQIQLNGSLIQKFIKETSVEQIKYDKLNHEYKNHLIGLKFLLDNQEYEKCANYLNQINSEFVNIGREFNTGNKCSDMILSSISNKHHNIRFAVSNPIPSTDDLRMIDFTSLLFNLIENGCEAAEKTIDKLVKVKIVSTQSHYLIQVENSSEINPIKTNFKTTKIDGAHGFGMEIIQDIVQKYSGEIYYNYNDSIFSVRISLRRNKKYID